MFQDTTPFITVLSITFIILICIAMWNSMNTKVEYKKGPEPQEGPSRTREILSRFSIFFNNLEPKEGYIYDTAILPDPKQHIIHALYVGFDESETDEDREAIRRGLNAIVIFQELVGEEPIKPTIEDKIDNLSTDELFKNNDGESDTMSNEEKKYIQYVQRKDEELLSHLMHLKIENQSAENEV